MPKSKASGDQRATNAYAVTFLDSGRVFPPELPLSEAVRVGNLLFLSGQLGLVPGTMTLVPGGIQAEARQALENIKTVLEPAGSSLGEVVKCTVMLADIGDWPAFNEIYKTFFPARPQPAWISRLLASSRFRQGHLAAGAGPSPCPVPEHLLL